MGVNLKDLFEAEPLSWDNLRGEKIGIDAMNALYQFLATIRQPDGTPLMGISGEITSHLAGLFYRTTRVLEAGVKPVYVFDGKPPDLKARELATRKERKIIAEEKWARAKEAGDIEAARKYAQQTSRFTPEMIAGAKELLLAMGVPIVNAPSEGEVQSAFMVQEGDLWASASQDYDSIVAGCPRTIRNLTMQEKYSLELLDLEKCLYHLSITHEQLVDLAILVGTDFNPGGVKGIGPKKGLKVVKEGKMKEYQEALGDKYEMIRELFLHPQTSKDYSLEWKPPNASKIEAILVEKHGFSEMRISRGIKRLNDAHDKNIAQSSLSNWV